MSMINIKASSNMTKRKSELLQMLKDDPRVIKFSMNMPAMLHHDLALISVNKGMKMAHIINSLILKFIQAELKDNLSDKDQSVSE